jgi:hypothetical protein
MWMPPRPPPAPARRSRGRARAADWGASARHPRCAGRSGRRRMPRHRPEPDRGRCGIRDLRQPERLPGPSRSIARIHFLPDPHSPAGPQHPSRPADLGGPGRPELGGSTLPDDRHRTRKAVSAQPHLTVADRSSRLDLPQRPLCRRVTFRDAGSARDVHRDVALAVGNPASEAKAPCMGRCRGKARPRSAAPNLGRSSTHVLCRGPTTCKLRA